MTDHHCRSLFMRQLDRSLQLNGNRLFGPHIVQKYIPRHAGQANLLRLGRGDRLGAGAAVDEELVPLLQVFHQPGHGLWL